MADLLALVDGLADDLANELETALETVEQRASVDFDDDTVVVTVKTTGPRYALADDDQGRRGFIPAYSVRNLVRKRRMISVSKYLRPGDEIPVRVVENDDGLFFIAREPPDRVEA